MTRSFVTSCACKYWAVRLKQAEAKRDSAASERTREAYQCLMEHYRNLCISCSLRQFCDDRPRLEQAVPKTIEPSNDGINRACERSGDPALSKGPQSVRTIIVSYALPPSRAAPSGSSK